eukprot:m.34945 g.34945  ORF g.34945 m.34945 type:complete len:349 (-) comp9565_c0_seq1:276-1322(-)
MGDSLKEKLILSDDPENNKPIEPLPVAAPAASPAAPPKVKITWRLCLGFRPKMSQAETYFVYARLFALVVFLILPFAIYSHDLEKVREAWYTPFLAIVAAAIPASGAPIAGGIIFIPVLQLDSLTVRNAIAFSSATQMLGVGVFAPASWLVRDPKIFLVKPMITAVLVGIFAELMVLLVIPDPGDYAVQIFFLVFIFLLAVNTAWGIFYGKLLVQDDSLISMRDNPLHFALLVFLCLVGGALTGYIAIGIDKIFFMLLTTLHHTHPMKTSISAITVVGLVSFPGAIVHFIRGTVPVNYWVTAIPGLLVGSMLGPIANLALGSRRILQLFVIILVVEIARSIQILATTH